MSQVIKSAPSSPIGKISRKVGDLSILKTPGSASRRGNVSLFGGKTPNQSFNHSSIFGAGKQGRGLAKRDLTPSRNPNRTFNGTTGGGDRFIPNRSQTQFDYANYMFQQPEDSTFNTSLSAPNSPQKNPEKDQMKQMMRTKSGTDLSSFNDERILVYKKNLAPLPPVGHLNQPKVLYSTSAIPTSSVRRTTRHIPSAPERILDAPCFIDDYYTNVLDWSSAGIVAVGLGFDVYMWNAQSGDISHLVALDDTSDANMITSVKWDGDGKYIAVGTMDGTIRLYDPERISEEPLRTRELRKMVVTRPCRTGVLAWRHHVVSAGHRSGQILHHDVRVAQHNIGMFEGHRQEVCGMKWSPDLRYLASGGGDNIVNIWDANQLTATNPVPEQVLDDHISTVRGIQWCPWKTSVLATGGGMQDMTLKLWDVSNGKLLKTVDTGSQVSDIIFNSDYKEIMTAHGNPNFEIKIWKYPTFAEVATLGGHTGRILSLAQSPCGQFVMSASSDESLRIWQCFKIDKSTAKLAQRKMLTGGSIR